MLSEEDSTRLLRGCCLPVHRATDCPPHGTGQGAPQGQRDSRYLLPRVSLDWSALAKAPSMRCRRRAGDDEVGIDDVIGGCQRICRHAVLLVNLGQRLAGLNHVDGLDRIGSGTHRMGG